MGWYPCCCDQGLSCCCGDDSPQEWVVNLGAGGWTDNYCDGCNEVSGEFIVVASGDPLVNGFCLYQYESFDWCEDNREGCVPDEGYDNLANLLVRFSMPLRNPLTTNCIISVEVYLTVEMGGELHSCNGGASAVYVGNFNWDDYDGCLDPDLAPLTLTKSGSDYIYGGICGGGALPSTITVYPVV